MDLGSIDVFSIVAASLVFASFATATSFMSLSLFYAVYKVSKLRVPSVLHVLSLSTAGMLQVIVSGLFLLLFDVIETQALPYTLQLLKTFFNEFLLSAYFQALSLITLNRYGLALRKGNAQQVSIKKTVLHISGTWLTSVVYGTLVTFYKDQQQQRRFIDAYPRGLAAAQFTFLGFTHFGTICLYINLAFHFYQKHNQFPPEFYSKNSSSRRTAERKGRVSVKNVKMIGLSVAVLCACHSPYCACITAAMFTGQLPRNIMIFPVVLIHCGIPLNIVVYGHCDKRFKRVLRPMLSRLLDRSSRWKGRKLHALMQRNNSFFSKFSNLSLERSEYELTR